MTTPAHEGDEPPFDLRTSEAALRELAQETTARIAKIDPRPGGRGLRRFLILLKAPDVSAARKRVSMRATVIMAQGARCAACERPFSKSVPASSHLNGESRLLCSGCFRAGRRRGPPAASE